MKTLPRLTLCAAVTADGKLDCSPASPGDFGPPPDSVPFALADRENPAELRGWFDHGLVAEVRLLVRPAIDGRRGAATLSGAPGEFFPAAVRCRLLGMEVRGRECLLRYRVLRARAKQPSPRST